MTPIVSPTPTASRRWDPPHKLSSLSWGANHHAVYFQETSVDSADLASTRLEKYFLTGFEEEQQLHSLDVISEGGNTDDSGSVGSESDGTGEVVPEPPRKKVKYDKLDQHQNKNLCVREDPSACLWPVPSTFRLYHI